MDPNALKTLMPILAGAGLREFTASIEKLMKTMGGGAAQGGKQHQPGGAPVNPAAASPGASTPNPAQAGGAPPAPNPATLMALMQLLRARQMGGMVA